METNFGLIASSNSSDDVIQTWQISCAGLERVRGYLVPGAGVLLKCNPFSPLKAWQVDRVWSHSQGQKGGSVNILGYTGQTKYGKSLFLSYVNIKEMMLCFYCFDLAQSHRFFYLHKWSFQIK